MRRRTLIFTVAAAGVAALMPLACRSVSSSEASEALSANNSSEESDTMLRVGDMAPDFQFTDLDGQTASLSGLLERGPAVVYFYPADFTGVCTRQACMFRDAHEDLAAAGVQVIGVSPQGDDSHARFRAENSLPFPLLADTDKRVIRAYGVDGPFGVGVRRASFFIGTDGRIEDVVLADLRVGPHQDFVRRVLERVRPSEPQP